MPGAWSFRWLRWQCPGTYGWQNWSALAACGWCQDDLGCWEKWVGMAGSGSGVCLNLLKTVIWREKRVSQAVTEKRRR
jgi:hypothetical protein